MTGRLINFNIRDEGERFRDLLTELVPSGIWKRCAAAK
jgi:hypothetical protein